MCLFVSVRIQVNSKSSKSFLGSKVKFIFINYAIKSLLNEDNRIKKYYVAYSEVVLLKYVACR